MTRNYFVEDCVVVNVPTFVDERGDISVLDKELPFQVKRVFWLYNIASGKERGSHALLDSSEVIFAIKGSFTVDLDDTVHKASIRLDDPSKGLIIKPGIWFRTHSYTEDGVSLILAEKEFARDIYLYDYEEYRKLRNI